MIQLIENGEKTGKLTKEELAILLKSSDWDAELFQAADRVRQHYMGNAVHLRGLIEFSNICRQNCCYCGLRRDNTVIERYRLAPETILDFARKAKSYGYQTVVLQSGEDLYYTVDKLVSVIREIKKLDLAITLSIGEKSREEYAAYKKAGADRYLLRIETTDKELYRRLDPGMNWEHRARCLMDLKSLGYELGSGSLVGLPGQTIESLADDILFFKEIDADMIGIGPFIPNGDTPLKYEAGGTFNLSVKVMALVRLLLRNINIPATTAMETLHPQGRILALQRGANVVMPNVTEGDYRRLYALYPGKICINDTPAHCRGCITGKIVGIGRFVSTDYGFRPKSE
ncbi:biotin synthase [Sporomusaceae bacterium BoRhaA]|uniref:[FeFe] hydrogenase H-cluster radical SAM maturase HydE n=1 Tax=Pelorhabdus rhamnosifermentans TaxID=2772457 RepID=UPI001C0622CB|nr:[FeFe] hydrogenase H-cluster radical SAM maturase HydE [Pelorhabdus rhamnosifermentans]MBU2699660.1 biotin synthase [Pelorhabdus rhamnosifermentans]